MDKPKLEHALIFIKIEHSSLLGNLFTQSWHDHDEGDIVRAVEITDDMRKKWKDKGNPDPGAGYYIPGCGFVSKAFATTDISDADYKKHILKRSKDLQKKIDQKKVLDKVLNFISRELVALRLQRKALKK